MPDRQALYHWSCAASPAKNFEFLYNVEFSYPKTLKLSPISSSHLSGLSVVFSSNKIISFLVI
jgi:hypothetical protein